MYVCTNVYNIMNVHVLIYECTCTCTNNVLYVCIYVCTNVYNIMNVHVLIYECTCTNNVVI